jgi:hypothetical protein
LLFHSTDVRLVRRMVGTPVGRAVRRPLGEAVERYAADVIVVLHLLLVAPAIGVRRHHGARVVTLVTDLGRLHSCWLNPDADHVVVPPLAQSDKGASSAVAGRGHPFGLPVRRQFTDPGLRPGRAGACFEACARAPAGPAARTPAR